MLDQSIIIILTPYHIQALKNVLDNFKLYASETIVLMPDSIDMNLLNPIDLESLKVITFPSKEYQLSGERFGNRLLAIIKNPFYIKRIRMVFNNNRSFVDSTLFPILSSGKKQLVIFNDRDFMAQIIISKLKIKFGESISIVAIDEGLGFYVKEGIKEVFMKMIYKIISPILFGFNYKFINQYGTHSQINSVYARFPDLIAKKEHVKYYSIPFDTNSIHALDKSKIWASKSILVISPPLTEENFVSNQVEISFYEFLGDYISRNNLTLKWKPHHRENKVKIANIVDNFFSNSPNVKFELIDKNVLAEYIDYSDYGTIITFGSSIILDLVFRGYPYDRIITIKPYNFYLTKHIFNKTRLIDIDENINLNLEKQLNDIFK